MSGRPAQDAPTDGGARGAPPPESAAARRDRLFDVGLAAPPDARAAALSGAGASEAERDDLLSLLAAHDASGAFLEQPAAATGRPDEAGDDGDDAVAGYTLVRRLGEGGFGVVWLAEQHVPVRREVALKLLKPGMDSREIVARFRAERQALALMSHPGIAQVYDAGLSRRGRPYFAMEYAPGRPISEAADARALPTEERLRLFVEVCEAVHHAHTQGVIHRDLKPGNVLVTERDGRLAVKVIDFGIAKALAGSPLGGATLLTSVGQLVGTLESMSPEQAAGDVTQIDTRTDVYALGVLLYELLTGTLPFASEALRSTSLAEAQRLLVEVDPPRPSTRLSKGDDRDERATRRGTSRVELARRLHGDLDWITMRALEKRKDDRYASVHELAEDVRRHLRHEPVLAGPPGTAYRVRKFVRRNRVLVAAASAVLLALAGGLVGTGLALLRALDAEQQSEERRVAAEASADEARRAEREANAARRQAEDARDVSDASRRDLERANEAARLEARKAYAVIDFLLAVLADPAFRAGHADPTLRDLLHAASLRLDAAYGDDPDVEGLLRRTLGLLFLSLDEQGAAEDELGRAIALLREREDGIDPFEALANPGQVQLPRDLRAAADDLARQLLERSRSGADEAVDPGRLLSTADAYALLLVRHGSWADSERLQRELVETRGAAFGADAPSTRLARNNLAAALHMQDRSEEAAREWSALVPLYRADSPRDDDTFATVLGSLASALVALGRLDEAEARAREAVALFDGRETPRDPARLTALMALAAVLEERGAYGEAEAILREVLDARTTDDGPSAITTLSTTSALGLLLLRAQRFDEAVELLRRAIGGARQELSDGHWFTASLRGDLGTCLIGLGRFDEAIDELSTALEGLRPVLGLHDPRTLAVAHNLVFACDWTGRGREVDDLRESLEEQ